jgi:hypothetical protein
MLLGASCRDLNLALENTLASAAGRRVCGQKAQAPRMLPCITVALFLVCLAPGHADDPPDMLLARGIMQGLNRLFTLQALQGVYQDFVD